jgi:prepilin-type N-terminal cleavage/methylation domain-containing protein
VAKKKRAAAGFTLIELMIAVAIVGILSAVAVPSFIKYVKKSRSTEARMHLEKLYNGARTYFYETTEAGKTMVSLQTQFPDPEVATPAVSCCTSGGGAEARCAPNLAIWEGSDTWKALKFDIPDPHYYQYEFKSKGVSITSEFTAFAYGDLDCDGIKSTFTMYGFVDAADGDPTLSASASRQRELE